MSRLLGAAVLCCALAACTAGTPGTPSPVATTSPRMDKPRNVANLDPCKLVTEDDFKRNKYGPFAAPPELHKEIPGTCAVWVSTSEPGNYLVVLAGVLPSPYEAEKANNPDGWQGLIEGHHVWFYCGGEERDISCVAWAAVAYERTLMVSLSRKDASESHLLLNTQGLITELLARMPS
ncbi:hypothetical protein LFM09_04775 [Lentzea alba]|uniref:hypothetical protein n=1 Tax=Lentzea alba TaxID=2714351 RepID=UPI0039BEF824